MNYDEIGKTIKELSEVKTDIQTLIESLKQIDINDEKKRSENISLWYSADDIAEYSKMVLNEQFQEIWEQLTEDFRE